MLRVRFSHRVSRVPGNSGSHPRSGDNTYYVAFTINILQSQLTPLELSVSEDTIWSVTLELLIMILETSFTLIYTVYIAGATYNER